MSTVLFRRRFEQTRPAGEPATTPRLELLDVPEFFADRYGLRQVEFWSRHFASLDDAYLRELRRRLRRTKATLINVQCDERYQIGSLDATERTESLALVLRWVDAAARVGARAIRVNPGRGDYDLAMSAYAIINRAARKRGLRLMIENHFGMAMDPDVHVRMVRSLGTDNVGTLPDFGNYADTDRFAALKRVLPYALQVSAKAVDFNAAGDHVSFDFDRCVRLAEASGFRGIYSVEQWSRNDSTVSDEKMGDWLVNHVRQCLTA